MWQAKVLTLFPEMFPGTLGHSIAKKASERGVWSLDAIDIRNFAHDKHSTVDDTPYGGGVGMVMRADVVNEAVEDSFNELNQTSNSKVPVFFLTPRGKPLNQEDLRGFVDTYKAGAVFLCSRYEGVDQRFSDYWQEKTPDFYEISLGDYILSGGDLAAQILIDAWVRLLPGVLEKRDATEIESFELDLLEFSQYTRPRVWNGMEVPADLLNGNHKKITEWRSENAREITKTRRPDLWQRTKKD